MPVQLSSLLQAQKSATPAAKGGVGTPAEAATATEKEETEHANEGTGKVQDERMEYLEIAAFRVAALLQMRNFRGAHEEMSRLGALSDVPLWGRDGGRGGLALRVLEAEVRNAMGQRRQAIDILYAVLTSVRARRAEIQSALGEAGGSRGDDALDGDERPAGMAGLSLLGVGGEQEDLKLLTKQQRTVTAALVAQHVEAGDYASARALLEDSLTMSASADGPATGESVDTAFCWALVRLHCHFGSVTAAERALAQCIACDAKAAMGVVGLEHKALVALVAGNNAEAVDLFREALSLQPDSVSCATNLALSQVAPRESSLLRSPSHACSRCADLCCLPKRWRRNHSRKS